MPVFQACRRDVLRAQTQLQPQLAHDMGRGVPGLANVDVQVFALARRQVKRLFIDAEIFRCSPQYTAGAGRVCQWTQIVPGEREAGHGLRAVKGKVIGGWVKRLTCSQMDGGGWQAEHSTLSLIHECVCEVAGMEATPNSGRTGVSCSGRSGREGLCCGTTPGGHTIAGAAGNETERTHSQ